MKSPDHTANEQRETTALPWQLKALLYLISTALIVLILKAAGLF